MFQTVPLSLVRSFSLCTQQWYMSYRFADSLRAVSKHVEFYSKNKLEKLVHLVGFIIRIYHDVRSPECQICVKIILRYKRVHSYLRWVSANIICSSEYNVYESYLVCKEG